MKELGNEKGGKHSGTSSAAGQDFTWRPGSGEGADAALKTLKRAERLRAAWRQLRADAGPSQELSRRGD